MTSNALIAKWGVGARALTYDAVAFAGATFGVAVVKAILPAFVAHRFGYHVFGELAAALAVAQAAAIFFELGISEWVLYVNRRGNESPPSLTHVIGICATALAFGFIAGSVFYFALRDRAWVRLMPLLLVLNGMYAAQLIVQAYLRSKFRVRIAAAIRIVQVASNLLCFFLLYVLGLSLTSTLVGLIGVELAILLLFIRAAATASDTAHAVSPEFPEVFRAYVPFAISTLAAYAYMSSDAFLLALLRAPHEVGDYSAATRLYMLAVQSVAVFAGTMLPFLYGAHGEELRQRIFSIALKLQLWIAMVGAGLVAISAPWLIGAYVGKEFATSVVVLSFLSVSIVAKGAAYMPAGILVASGRQNRRMRVQVGAAILNVALNLVLIPRFGLWAALGSTLFCDVVLVTGYLAYAKPLLRGALAKRANLRLAVVVVLFLLIALTSLRWPVLSKLLALLAVVFPVVEGRAHWGEVKQLLHEFGKATEVSRSGVSKTA